MSCEKPTVSQVLDGLHPGVPWPWRACQRERAGVCLELQELGLSPTPPLPLVLVPISDLPSEEGGFECSPHGHHGPDCGDSDSGSDPERTCHNSVCPTASHSWVLLRAPAAHAYYLLGLRSSVTMPPTVNSQSSLGTR